jgi:hypothetical protein
VGSFENNENVVVDLNDLARMEVSLKGGHDAMSRAQVKIDSCEDPSYQGLLAHWIAEAGSKLNTLRSTVERVQLSFHDVLVDHIESEKTISTEFFTQLSTIFRMLEVRFFDRLIVKPA